MSAADKLDAIEARANAATEGPWEWDGDSPDDVKPAVCPHGNEWTDHGPDLVTVAKKPPYMDGSVGPVENVITSGGHDASWLSINSPDADFIAHARQDVPALVAALRAVLAICGESDRQVAGINRTSLPFDHEVIRAAITTALDGPK